MITGAAFETWMAPAFWYEEENGEEESVDNRETREKREKDEKRREEKMMRG